MNTLFKPQCLLLSSCFSLCLVAQSVQAGKISKAKAYTASSLLDTLLDNYDKRLRPGFGGPPTEVDVNLNIRSMGPISETDMAYQMDCYFRQSWVDKRLEFQGNGTPNVLPVAINILDRLWKPDTHFFNGKQSYLHTVTSPNKLLRINKDGRILYSMRLTIKASCPMHLEMFPMDVQTCPLSFGSHGYGVPDVLYKWTYGPQKSIKMASDMTLSQFDLIGFPHGNDSKYQPNIGTFSILFVKFTLRRHMGYFLINVYVPCSLLVVLSWVAFWINREATSDRIALGITTVLTMCFMSIDNRRDIPKVSYSTALDYFVGTCFAFVLATIIQFSGVHFFTKHGSGEIQHDSESEEDWDEEEDEHVVRSHLYSSNGTHGKTSILVSNSKSNGQANAPLRYTHMPVRKSPGSHPEYCCKKFLHCLLGSYRYRKQQQRSSRYKSFNSVSRIDRASRILFPASFIGFNIFYWAVYLRSNIAQMVM